MEVYQRWTSDDGHSGLKAATAVADLLPESVKEDLQNVDVSGAIKHVLGGEVLSKFWRQAGLQHIVPAKARMFQVQCVDGVFTLSWQGKRKSGSSVRLADVTSVIPGSDSLFLKKRKAQAPVSIELVVVSIPVRKRLRLKANTSLPDKPNGRRGSDARRGSVGDGRRRRGSTVQVRATLETSYLRVVCPSAESWRLWFVGLLALVQRTREISQASRVCKSIQNVWRQTVNEETQLATFEGMVALLKDMNFKCDVRYLILLVRDRTRIEYLEFEKVLGRLLTQSDLMDMFYKITGNRDSMTRDELVTFLQDVQLAADREELLETYLNSVPHELAIESLTRPTTPPSPGRSPRLAPAEPHAECLTDIGFNVAMMSPSNSICNPAAVRKTAAAMLSPLAHYFIKTYHNPCFLHPWCLGSPISRLQRVLQENYRCLEFDVFESMDGECVVPCGSAPPRYVSFMRVLRVCKEEAFKTNPYPLLIFLSIDCTLALCAELGQQIKSTLGKQLILLSDLAAFPGDKSEGKIDWDLQPANLMNHMVIGAKRHYLPMKDDESFLSDVRLRHLEVQYADHSPYDEVCMVPPQDKNSPAPLASFASDLSSHRSLRHTGRLDRSKGLLALELKAYADTISLIDNGTLLSDCPHRTVINTTSAQPLNDVDYKTQLARVSPCALLSTLTTPPNAIQYWRKGIQMVSYFESPGIGEWIQRARFLENGRCGYILKPAYLRGLDAPSGSGPRELSLKVLGGRQLFVPYVGRRSFSVRVSLFDDDRETQVHSTSAVESSGLDPRWNERLVFEIKQPSFALVVFEVSAADEVVCGFAVPAACIQQGIRWVPLWDLGGHIIPWAGLIVHSESKLLRQLPLENPPELQRRNSLKPPKHRRLSVAPQPVLNRRASLTKIVD
ncbi:phosphoinositide phospholipase C [Gregarina niphandrodes]|uniref:Phosphoinositide phospholipase C n=1 Tax=Gregarina niphandrodes TaxID=110365 RepID=A0A023BCT3_GRENI|nr:phosphoinositide phospholipase C [Gregarina niphandrodes]EZG86313.1 phosphoinositide phospholipase C [Gregarina niphandrodes]|eukprot:XP_011128764.1 phosphoinositide phospholipase C [Gregarina niphandrodes]